MTTQEEKFVEAGKVAKEPAVPRDAASLVIFRGEGDDTEVLMGKRPETARFMPGVLVYPGGAVDAGDEDLARALGCREPVLGALAACAVRETWEEAGVLLGQPGVAPTVAGIEGDGAAFLAASQEANVRPAPDRFRYFCHAVTPKEVPIRFDVRFFICDDSLLVGDPHPTGELPEVRWVPCSEALAAKNLSGITKRVLREALRLWGKPSELSDPDRKVAQIFYETSGYRILREERGGDMDEIWHS